ncbi:hypothetical protein BAE39_30000 [Mesorhizobium loti]|uniref:Uncharacterized protein n=1 Tax=Rhizobium loti TaxID=381 RepID=A0A1A5IHB3_RHILI|nr:hypothetical protein BAE39_30000 [Mesorhizobium loti]OBQ70273.1 hypothetical protein A8145_28360 [Mesorhizobium loti]
MGRLSFRRGQRKQFVRHTDVLEGRAHGEEIASCDVIIVGAGFAGMYMLYLARRLGLSAVVLETASGGWRNVVLQPLSGDALRR